MFVVHLIRIWWPVPLLVVGSVVAQKVLLESRYDVSGHAAEHLSGASAPFGAIVLAAVILIATPSARRRPLVLVALAAWLAATALVLIGNVRVVDALTRAGLGDTPTSALVVDDAIESAHGLANISPWYAVITALALTVTMWRYRYVSRRVAIWAAVVSVVFPPWIFPGAGVFVLAVARCFAFHQELTAKRTFVVPTP